MTARCTPGCPLCGAPTVWGEACPRCVIAEPAVGQAHTGAGDTERYAALAVAPRTGTLRLEVLSTLGAHEDGLTDEQLATVMAKRQYSVAPRRTELLHGEWVRDSGQRRPTSSGSPAIVWVLTEKAWAALPTILRGAA